MIDVALFVAFAALGMRLQRDPRSQRWRAALWTANYWLLIPAAAVFTVLSLRVDRSVLYAAMCGVVAWWVVVALSWSYARAVAPTRSARGALLMIGAFPNTGFVGFPLAHLAFGADGLRWAVIYDQVGLVIPALVLSNAIAAAHGTSAHSGARPAAASVLRQVVLAPPLITLAVAAVVRVAWIDGTLDLDALGWLIGHTVGPVGFLLLGLSIPLSGFSHHGREVLAVAGAVGIRLLAAPLVLVGVAALVGVGVPAPLVLASAMPTAFHVIIASRLHGMEEEMVRLGAAASTTLAVLAVSTYAVLT
jgi:hypothetical protein